MKRIISGSNSIGATSNDAGIMLLALYQTTDAIVAGWHHIVR
ncbi:hypothetical protein [Thermocoleostomius sinensis]|jgi:hypothetical protein|uniref:Uncharacterized protein n=1 Tax=Thermocoleostomius sinensis A174 TaxID=2016057 RepID=A0A9E8ZHK7_9CYAN|nr:hypothetical protein [Thermocoleostomius sinensis]WAL61887.1 hypothetical protein OXH18_07865 [Thermocoleostomius sinensis A174]